MQEVCGDALYKVAPGESRQRIQELFLNREANKTLSMTVWKKESRMINWERVCDFFFVELIIGRLNVNEQHLIYP